MKKAIAKTLSLFALASMFPDEAAAVAFFEKILWRGKPICPKCGGENIAPRPVRHGHRCKSCRKDFTVRNGTVFSHSRLPLRMWIFAMYANVTSRKGVSSLQLSKELGITQKSAWFMLHRIRKSAAPEMGEMLSGVVEIDESFFGGLEQNKHEWKKRKDGRGAAGKAAVMGMRERGGRTLAFPIPNTTRETLCDAVRENVAVGSVICTDDFPAYRSLDGEEYAHFPVKHSAKEYVNKMTSANGVESVWAVMKRGHAGVYHRWSVKRLHRHVSEFAFRLNEGACEVDTIDRIGALVSASVGRRLTWKALTR